MSKLPPASHVSFATARDAFKYDWKGHFASAGAPVVEPSLPALQTAPMVPRPLASIVAFYVTRRPAHS